MSADPYLAETATWVTEMKVGLAVTDRRAQALLVDVAGPRFYTLDELERRYAALPASDPEHAAASARLARVWTTMAAREAQAPPPCSRCGLPFGVGGHGPGFCVNRRGRRTGGPSLLSAIAPAR